MQLNNTDYIFSYYNNLVTAKQPNGEFDINQLIETIKYGYLKEEISTLRNEKDKNKRSKLKQVSLPTVTLSGTFTLRNKKSLIEHSGLMQIDIDNVKNYDELFQTLINDEYTYVAFKSPSGNGIKLIVKVNRSIETHLEQFLSLEKYYLDEYNIEIDSACKDVSRCMLLSYDPMLYCNPFAEVYAELYVPAIKELPINNHAIKHSININSNKTIDVVEKLTTEIERNGIDITNGYENWIRVGFSLASSLGENGRSYYHRLSNYNQGYNSNECDRKYSNLLETNNNAISLGTLIHITREHGIDVKFPNNKDSNNVPEAIKTSNKNTITLYDLLKNKRLELANEIGKPAFTIFTNKTLDELVAQKPKTEKELLNIHGISQKKSDKYADKILPLINDFNEVSSTPLTPIVQKYTLPKLNNEDIKLYEELKSLRLQLANNTGMRAFHIFGNSTLDELVKEKPKTEKNLLEIKGIGKQKLNQFGSEIIELTRSF